MYEKTFKSTEKMTNGNVVTHNTKHTNLINKTKFTPYSVPPAQAPASVCVKVTRAFYFGAPIGTPHTWNIQLSAVSRWVYHGNS